MKLWEEVSNSRFSSPRNLTLYFILWRKPKVIKVHQGAYTKSCIPRVYNKGLYHRWMPRIYAKRLYQGFTPRFYTKGYIPRVIHQSIAYLRFSKCIFVLGLFYLIVTSKLFRTLLLMHRMLASCSKVILDWKKCNFSFKFEISVRLCYIFVTKHFSTFFIFLM